MTEIAENVESNVEENEEGTEEESTRASKPRYIDTADSTLLNEDGQLTSMPVDYDSEKTRQPRRIDFADECDYFDWKAGNLEEEANELVAMAAKLRETSTTMRKYGDPETRAKVQKLARLRENLEALEKWATDEGIDLPA